MEGEVLWTPTEEVKRAANITAYTNWLEEKNRLSFANYAELWEWSTENVENFWETIWNFFEIRSATPYTSVLKERRMPGAKWFEGSRLNYAEHVFRSRRESDIALVAASEDGLQTEITWAEFRRQTACLAAGLLEMGVRAGDRVAAYLPNVPEAAVGLMASASIGAVWSSCSPDLRSRGVIDRFKQITPKVLLAVDGCSRGGEWLDQTSEVEQIRKSIPSIEATVLSRKSEKSRSLEAARDWEDLVGGGRDPLRFATLPFDHPLWILYSSGTTGPPKPIVHSQGGILLEHLKGLWLHNNMRPKERMFWYTSTGWMMWNYLMGALLAGSSVVLYDGDPFYPTTDALWSVVDRARVNFFGASAAYVSAMIKSRRKPLEDYALRGLTGFGSTGSALASDGFEWLHSNVKEDMWIASMSGGTDVCTCFVGGCPTLPVRSGWIQCRWLGAEVECYDKAGKSIVDEMGELVVTKPLPSMPSYIWGDPTGEQYLENYFSMYPGVWRHGDWIRIQMDGSCIIYGRSDATIKRMGVRVGTSEIYAVVEAIPEVVDSIVVDTELLGGRSFLPLFVVLRQGATLDGALEDAIRRKIREELSPNLVPDGIFQIEEVPRTLNGKKLEVPLRRILLGVDRAQTFSPDSLKNPDSMNFFIDFARRNRARMKS